MWIKDPKNNEGSVSLTMLAVTFTAAVCACVLEMNGTIKSTSSITELFYACCGLYFSRRLNFNGKTFSSEKPTGEQQ